MNPRFLILCLCLTSSSLLWAEQAAPGQTDFERNCAACHGGDAMGGEMGPNIVNRLPNMTDEQLDLVLHDGRPQRGMPAFPNLAGPEKAQLVAYLRTLRPRRRPAAPVRRSVSTTTGLTLTGLVINEGLTSLELRTDDNRIHLLRPESGRYREVTSQTDWSTYNGDVRGNRYSKLAQIDKINASKLAAQWVFTMEGASARSETTPIVVQGIMYVTSGNECWALDAGVGREIWHFQRARTRGLVGNAAGGFNRGAAALGDRLFMVTDNAHLLALNRFTGELVWETEMADWKQNYNATSAPLVVDGLVITGTAGGEQGARGFLAAFSPETGKEVWRFWTVPKPGEPGSETWDGKAIDHPSGVAWLTGSYDPELDMLYWATGNPGPDYNGEERKGDNLYTSSILALDPKTGRLKWFYQTTPHDTHDWDATEPLVAVDADWQGTPRKLLIQANRNGFFYVFDRSNGKLLLSKPFIQNINWAKEIGPDGKPVMLPPVSAGAPNSFRVCPSQDGATNWFSSSFDPASGRYFIQTFEKCSVYTTRTTEEWQAGKGYSGGTQRLLSNENPKQILRALDFKTGNVVWELPQVGPASSWGGTLLFSSGVLFVCADGGSLLAIDSATGKTLWQFETSATLKASPMTYEFDGKQYVAVAAGQNILSFAINR